MPDITDTVEEIAEDIAADAVKETQNERDRPPWDSWVALSSSILAVLSALAALYATFAIDEASLVFSNSSDYAAYQQGSLAGLSIMKAKVEILSALDKPVSKEDVALITQFADQVVTYQQKANDADSIGNRKFTVHDRLAISVTLFQVAILMGGLAVVVRRKSVWILGLSFAFCATGMLSWGLITF